MDNPAYLVDVDGSVTPEDVVYAREEAAGVNLDVWKVCLKQSLCVVSARERESNKVVGIGFLVGNKRHGQIVDLNVHSSLRKAGLGGQIFDTLVRRAKELGIRYLGLTYDTSHPWLKDFYGRHGFRSIDFAMWEEASLGELPSPSRTSSPS